MTSKTSWTVSLSALWGPGDCMQIEGMDEDEFEIHDEGPVSAEDMQFDQVVGCLQEVLMDEEFSKLQK